jgi:hypothetical protein
MWREGFFLRFGGHKTSFLFSFVNLGFSTTSYVKKNGATAWMEWYGCRGAVQVSCILSSLFSCPFVRGAVKPEGKRPPKRAAHRNTQNALFCFPSVWP